MPEFPVMKLKCSNCGYEWIPNKSQVITCAKCKVPLEKHKPKIIIVGDLSDYEVEEREL